MLAGAGTLALEIEEQGGRLPDTLLVSVGGGGLIGGVAAWVESRAHVVALEPERAPTLHAARAAGQPVDVEVGGLAADSLGARRIGAIGWEVSQRHVHASLLLPDDAIRAAQLWLWKEFKLAVEPAAALGLAALQTGAYRPQAKAQVMVSERIDQTYRHFALLRPQAPIQSQQFAQMLQKLRDNGQLKAIFAPYKIAVVEM